jgi:hypothetical protein
MKVTAEDIAQLLGSSPREVPRQVKRAAMRTCARWRTAVSGMFFFGMGVLFTWAFFPWGFITEWRLSGAGAVTTPGMVRSVVDAKMKINGAKVMEYVFSYTPAGSPSREATCFTSGKKWDTGESVNVRYLTADPGLACIEGGRLSKGNWFGAIVIVFPLVGGALVGWFIMDRSRTRWLLREGQVAEVNIMSVKDTNQRVNGQTVYKIVIAGSALEGGQPITVKRINQAEVDLASDRLEKKQPVFVLYNPQRTKQMLFPEALIDGDA